MNERDFAKRITTSLDEGARQLDPVLAMRLASMRRLAVDNRPAHYHMGHGVAVWAHEHPWVVMLLAISILFSGWLGYSQRQTGDSGDVDILLLTDDLPPQAYAERDFNKWLHLPAR